MCGITGIWSPGASSDNIRLGVERAVSTLRHRGPDDKGIWLNEKGVGLGHTRLSILDLSSLGHQPKVSDNGRLVLCFNGEIYNFKEIRHRLELAGHSFSSSGDTEVILHAFSEWGFDAAKQFIGMFAIALWDEHEKELMLIRDRVGIKPLYFSWDGRSIIFGSELKALLAYEHRPKNINLEALGEFLQYGYIAGDRTIFNGMQKLKPGHRLVIKEGSTPVIEQYWSVTDSQTDALIGSDAELEAQLEDLLIDSFRYRMVSDVPVGVFLSGGIDSSLLTAILTKHHRQDIQTFTIGFAEDSHNEAHWAKQVAMHCGSSHTEYILDVKEAMNIVVDWGELFDEPFGDPSGIPTLLVSRLASQEVKVVLSADGGDELFSGYNVYSRVLRRFQQLNRLPSWFCLGLNITASNIAAFPQRDSIGRLQKSPKSLRNIRTKIDQIRSMMQANNIGKLFDLYVSYWQPSEIAALIGSHDFHRTTADSYAGDPATQLALWDFCNYLPEDILTKLDRTTMAVSIEGRDPLLDHRIAEFAFQLPMHLRRGDLGPKHILKKILFGYIPQRLVDRPKQGFGVPLHLWLRSDLRELMNDYLSESRISTAGLMNAKLITRAIRQFEGGDATLTKPLWFLLAFEMWRDNWV